MQRIVMQRTVMQLVVVQRTVMQRTVMQRTIMQRTVMQRTALQRTVMQLTVVQRTVMQRTVIQQTGMQRTFAKLFIQSLELFNPQTCHTSQEYQRGAQSEHLKPCEAPFRLHFGRVRTIVNCKFQGFEPGKSSEGQVKRQRNQHQGQSHFDM